MKKKVSSDKALFTADYEMHASVKMLYPYIQTAGGLSEWFAEDVRINPEKVFTFVWENEEHRAILANHRVNHYVKFEYLAENEADKDDPSYFEITLDVNDLTQTTFLKVSDYSSLTDTEELQDIWDSQIERLRKVVGG